ncbi:MAG: polyprenol monophosphomannose synthase [Armatimonadetes bacterium]|nr:polyprenol monophosphomannose synthase [Armatimonadota bacterium]
MEKRQDSHSPQPRLSVIVPTYNERASLPGLVGRLAALRAMSIEVVVVDDASPDGTGHVAEALARQQPVPILVIHRPTKRGLASAVIDGAAVARGAILTVMDADLSHPPELLPELASAIASGADIAIASGYVTGGGIRGWPRARRVISRAATALARAVLGLERDPLSGFFAVRRELLAGSDYLGLGYKLLLEVLAAHRNARVIEVPYEFVNREHGHSKLSSGEFLSFLRLLLHLKMTPQKRMLR